MEAQFQVLTTYLLVDQLFVSFISIPWIFFIVYRRLFLTIMTVTCTAVFIITLLPFFDRKENRKWRGIVFIALGFTAAAPLFYLCWFRDPLYTMEPPVLTFLLGGIIYAGGACIYITRVPERCKPGCFDIFGHSH